MPCPPTHSTEEKKVNQEMSGWRPASWLPSFFSVRGNRSESVAFLSALTCLLVIVTIWFRFCFFVSQHRSTTMAVAPGSPSLSSAASWAIPTQFDTYQQEARDSILSALKPKVIAKGGPGPYVRSILAAPGEAQKYADWLWDFFPEDPCIHYEYHRQMPSVDESAQAETPPLCLHPATLGYSEKCSLKPLPTLEVYEELSHQILQDGFMTQTEPLLFAQVLENMNTGCEPPWKAQDPQPMKPFQVPFTKGSARTLTLHALLLEVWMQGMNLEARLPAVHASITRIYGHCRVHGSKVDEALENMKISLRGSIRRRTNLIQLAMMIEKLTKEHGLADFGEFLRRWNTISGRQAQVTGKKAHALKLLFDSAPKDCPRPYHSSVICLGLLKQLILSRALIMVPLSCRSIHGCLNIVLLAFLAL